MPADLVGPADPEVGVLLARERGALGVLPRCAGPHRNRYVIAASLVAGGPVEDHLERLATLDPAEYPHLTSVADPWVHSTGDRTFDVGLGLIGGLRRWLSP